MVYCRTARRDEALSNACPRVCQGRIYLTICPRKGTFRLWKSFILRSSRIGSSDLAIDVRGPRLFPELNDNFGDHRSVGGGVSELRIQVGKGYRAYYAIRRNTVVIEYLNVALEENDPKYFARALDNVVRAKKISSIAEARGPRRQVLYRMLSNEDNPRIDTLYRVLDTLNLRLAITR